MSTANNTAAYVIVALAGFGIGWAGMAVYHELGHAVAAWLSGERVTGFWANSIDYTGPDTVGILYAGYVGGVLLPTLAILALRCRAPLVTAWLALKPLQEWMYELRWTSDEQLMHAQIEWATALYAIGMVIGLLVAVGAAAYAAGVLIHTIEKTGRRTKKRYAPPVA